MRDSKRIITYQVCCICKLYTTAAKFNSSITGIEHKALYIIGGQIECNICFAGSAFINKLICIHRYNTLSHCTCSNRNKEKSKELLKHIKSILLQLFPVR